MRQALLLGAVADEAARLALVAAVDALTQAGYAVLATGDIGSAIGRAGRTVLPIELHTREPSLLGGRFELAHLRVFAAVAGDFNDPREADALRARSVAPIEIVCGQLPLSGRVLGSDARGAFIGAMALRRSPWLLHAAVIESACLHAEDILVLHDPSRLPELLKSLRGGGIDVARRATLAEDAWRHIGAFRDAAAELLGLPRASVAPQSDFGARFGHGVAVPPRSVTRISGAVVGIVDPVVVHPQAVAGATSRTSGAFAPTLLAASASRVSGAHAIVDATTHAVVGTEAHAAIAEPAAALEATAADAPAEAEAASAWPELPVGSRAHVALPAAAQPQLGAEAATLDAIDPTRRADLAAALAVLEALDEPAVVIASGGLPCVAVRQVGSAARAMLRAFAADPLALQGGTLATTVVLDLTATRALLEPAGASLGRIAWIEAEDEAGAMLQAEQATRTLQFQRRPDASHSLVCDALGAWFLPRRALPSANTLASKLAHRLQAGGAPGAAAAALRLGLALVRLLPGRSAVAVHPELAFAIVGGQAHISDALQIAIAKVRKPLPGTILVANAVPPDLRLLASWVAADAPVAFVDLAPGATLPAGLAGPPPLMLSAAELDAWAAAEATS